MNHITAMIKAADEQRNGKGYSISRADIDGIGTITCYRDYGIRKAGFQHHARTTWRLNGKVISQANLAKLVA